MGSKRDRAQAPGPHAGHHPCIPSSWPSFEIDYRYGAATYHIVVENPDRVCHGVVGLEVDGQRLSDGYIRLETEDKHHEVTVTLGRALSTRVSRPSGASSAPSDDSV